MTNGKRAALIEESEAWRRQLALLEDENIHFKTRLAGILRHDFRKDQLEQLEYFQNRFLKMDEQLSLLRHEVGEQLYLLSQAGMHQNGQFKKVQDLQKRLEVKIIIVHENFSKLSTEFNGYLQEHFPLP
ncbi:hypothetical protein [Chitinophaga japonensis]|nr:hypothetical protein [Chitinophaga japonensis]